MSELELPGVVIQVHENPWCHAGTTWHFKPHQSSAGVGSYKPSHWREDMQCGLPIPSIREWEMKILFNEGQFRVAKRCKECGQELPEAAS